MKIMLIGVTDDERLQITKASERIDNFEISFWDSYLSAKKHLELNIIDLLFFNIDSYAFNWMEQFDEIKMIDKAIKIIPVSAHKLNAVKAYVLDAYDFLVRPIDSNGIDRILRKAGIVPSKAND